MFLPRPLIPVGILISAGYLGRYFCLSHASHLVLSKISKLFGSLFRPNNTVSAASLDSGDDDNFFVHHEEPLGALEWPRRKAFWSVGHSLDGFQVPAYLNLQSATSLATFSLRNESRWDNLAQRGQGFLGF